MKKKLYVAGFMNREEMAPWRKDYSESALNRIAAQRPLSLEMLRSHYSQANAKTVERLKAKGDLEQPEKKDSRWNFQIAIKQCTDARQVTIDLDMLERFLIIHERTAGNVVRNGMAFKSLSDLGVGIVEGHYQCGATGVAYKLRNSDLSGIDEHILRIITAVSPHVQNIAESGERDRENAVDQAWRVKRILRRINMSNNVYAGFFTWENGPHGPNYQWLGEQSPDPQINFAFHESSSRIAGFSLAEGRSFDTQYATITMMYDPYRLGRINDPRVIFDALVNEMFCVTFDLRRMEDETIRPLSRTGMGSVKYANFDKGGHVAGVGGEDGTHALGIVDPDENVLDRVKGYLLDNFPQIKELTQNGLAILPIKYDPETAKAEFL